MAAQNIAMTEDNYGELNNVIEMNNFYAMNELNTTSEPGENVGEFVQISGTNKNKTQDEFLPIVLIGFSILFVVLFAAGFVVYSLQTRNFEGVQSEDSSGGAFSPPVSDSHKTSTTTHTKATTGPSICDNDSLKDAANLLLRHLNDSYVYRDGLFVRSLFYLSKRTILKDTLRHIKKGIYFHVKFIRLEGHCTELPSRDTVTGEIIGHGTAKNQIVSFTAFLESGKLNATAELEKFGKIIFRAWEDCKNYCGQRQRRFEEGAFQKIWSYWGDKLFPNLTAETFAQNKCFQD